MKKLPALPAAFAAVYFLLVPPAFPAGIYEIKTGQHTGVRTVTGVVSAVESTFRFFIAEGSAAYRGIYINQTEYGPDIGDEVTVTGTVATSAGRIQLQNITDYTVNSIDNPVHAPIEMNVSHLITYLDAYEGSLVKLTTPLTVSNQNSGSSTWQAGDGTGTVTVNTALDYNYFPRNGDRLTSIAGIVKKTGTSSFQLQPRFTADLWAANEVIPNYALKGTVVTMDDARQVFDSYYIWVRGDSIESVTPDAPAGAEKIVDVDGLIFPGLISTHDHPTWNAFDFIPFGRFFRERNDWANDVFGGTMYHDFKKQKNGFGMDDEVIKLTEVRLASGGATVLQGAGSAQTGKLGVGIIHGERFPGRVQTSVLGTTSNKSLGGSTVSPAVYWADRHQRGVRGTLHRYIPHLAETTDDGPTMSDQWTLWKGYDSFDGRDTIIHGMNIPAADFALFDHGLDPFGRPLLTVLSWACLSNMLLYNDTADIPGALARGAIVALAPDWTPSGMPNMLAELNFARSVALDKGWNIQTQTFIDMVTRNAAIGFGQLWRYGTIEAGKMANLMVIDDGPGDPYDDLMMVAGGGEDPDYRGGPKDVKLTVMAGRPIYGDGDLLNTANFPFLAEERIEDLTICGRTKKLKYARFNPGWLNPIAGQPFEEMYLDLWARYSRSDQYPCDFLPVDPCGAVPPTPAPSPSPPPGIYIVNHPSDDAHQHSSYYSDNDSYVWFGRRDVPEGYNAGYRFNDIQVARGQTVLEARLVLTQYTSYNSKTPKLLVAADKTDDSPTFASGASGPLNRDLTDHQVSWTVGYAAYDQEISSPEIKTVIQEIVNRAGWNPGNSISIILAADESSVDNRRRSWSYDGSPEKAARLEIVTASLITTPTPTPFGYKTPSPTPSAPPTRTPTPSPTRTPTPTPTATPVPTPSTTPTPIAARRWMRDYDGDGTSDIALFRPASGLWAVRGITRFYFGREGDKPVPADYSGDGTTDIAVFRPDSGLWAIRGWSRYYFGQYGDRPLPADYLGLGRAEIAIFRPASGLWAIRNLPRIYFGGTGDIPVPGYYAGPAARPAIFRPASGLWAVYKYTRTYFGSAGDIPVPGDYIASGTWSPAVFRPASGLWAVRGVTRVYFGTGSDLPVPGGYRGDGRDRFGIFRGSSGLWAVRDVTRTYFGTGGDQPLSR